MLNVLCSRLAPAVALLCIGVSAQGQSLRGTVTEAQSGRPVAGAVVLLMDASGFVLYRGVTSEHGAYSVRRPPAAVRGQVLRLGFRPRVISADDLASADVSGELSFTIAAIPQMLEPVVARAAANCPKRKDTQAAFGFWEQAKAGLMAAVYAREGSPGLFHTLSYERYLRPGSDSIQIQKVTTDSGQWTRTFLAEFTARDFVDVGFVRARGDGRLTYYGPDAEVLLEHDFQSRYCFSLAAADPGRPTQVGLHFAPVRKRINRVDIEGDFWIDTASRKLNDIVYEYVEMAGPARRRPAGHVRFRELANGIPFVDSWDIRMAAVVVQQRARLTRGGGAGEFGGMTRNAVQFDVTHGGGVLAHARFPDGSRYDAPLGTVRIKAMTEDGKPVAGLTVALDSTFYGGVTDSLGYLVINDVLEGPYETIVIDTTLDAIGLKLRSPLAFYAIPDDTVEAALFVRDAAGALARACHEQEYGGWAMFVARVSTPDSKPVEGAKWSFGGVSGATRENGVILPCNKLRVGDTWELLVWRDRGFPTPDRPYTVRVPVTQAVTAIKVELPPLPDAKNP